MKSSSESARAQGSRNETTAARPAIPRPTPETIATKAVLPSPSAEAIAANGTSTAVQSRWYPFVTWRPSNVEPAPRPMFRAIWR